MKSAIHTLREKILHLNLNTSEQAELMRELKAVEKYCIRSDFRLNRTLKDKSIVLNLHKTTIKDLQEQQLIIEKSNHLLSHQKQQIELKNKELEHQKKIVEEHSIRLKKNLKALERSYKDLEQFSYIASHDLKSPLRTIASYAQLLKRRYEGQIDETADEFIRFIVMGANHMNDIICDLLEYSKAGGREADFSKTNLNNTLEIVKFNLRQEIIENQAEVVHQSMPELKVNKSSMLQLFQNLIANAIKFRKLETAPVIDIRSHREKDLWHFVVKDNGVGMDEVFQDKAFLPFQRLNNRERPGTGMGLAICKKIIKMHNGNIWYHSRQGQGTAFHFTIPT